MSDEELAEFQQSGATLLRKNADISQSAGDGVQPSPVPVECWHLDSARTVSTVDINQSLNPANWRMSDQRPGTKGTNGNDMAKKKNFELVGVGKPTDKYTLSAGIPVVLVTLRPSMCSDFIRPM